MTAGRSVLRLALLALLLVAAPAFADRSVPGDGDGKSWSARCAAAIEGERGSLPDGTLTVEGRHVRFERDGLVLDVVEERDPAAADDAWHVRGSTGIRTVGARSATVMVLGDDEQRARNRAAWSRIADRCLDGAGLRAPPDFSGRYLLDGSVAQDDCAHRVVLAARTIDIPRGAATLHADVVDRVYAARVSDGKLQAEGSFPTGQCGGAPLVERWILQRLDGRTLSGTLESTWRLGPDCDRSCTVRFRLRATATRDGVNPAR